MSVNLIKTEKDGIEFYVNETTGECGINQTALATLCGIKRTSIQKLELAIGTSAPSEPLKPFVGKNFYIAPNLDCSIATSVSSRPLKPLTCKDSSIAPSVTTIDGQTPLKTPKIYRHDFCIAVIEHYAFHAKKRTSEAEFAFRKFAGMGIKAWIHEVMQSIHPSSRERHALPPGRQLLNQLQAQSPDGSIRPQDLPEEQRHLIAPIIIESYQVQLDKYIDSCRLWFDFGIRDLNEDLKRRWIGRVEHRKRREALVDKFNDDVKGEKLRLETILNKGMKIQAVLNTDKMPNLDCSQSAK